MLTQADYVIPPLAKYAPPTHRMGPSWSVASTTTSKTRTHVGQHAYPRATAVSGDTSSISMTNSNSVASSASSMVSSASSNSPTDSSSSPLSAKSTQSSPPPPPTFITSTTSSTTSESISTTSASSPSPPPLSSPPPPPPTFSSPPIPSSSDLASSSSFSPSPSPSIFSSSFSNLNTQALSSISSISSISNSANVTVTVFVSPNPTNNLGPPEDDTSQGFFSHTGGVAGTFLVIGLFSTSIFLYIFFWFKRKIRRRRITRRVYMQNDYNSLSRSLDRQQATPEPRPSRDSASIRRLNSTPPPPRSSNNSLAQIPFPSMDHSPYQAEPGEFDPYKPEAVTKVYSNDYAEASEYEKYLTVSRNH